MQPELRIPAQTGELSVSQNRVLRNTYLMLSLTMIPTLIGAMIGMQLNFGIMRTNPIMSFVVIMAVFYGMVFAIEKYKDSGLGVALLLGFTFLMGLLLAPLLQVALALSGARADG
jgi:FtsH-binding integral membrane protein